MTINLKSIKSKKSASSSKIKNIYSKIDYLSKSPYLHVILFSIYPILFIYYHNISELYINVVLLPIAISLLGALILWRLIYLLWADTRKSALLTTLVLILFFSFTNLSQFLMDRFSVISSFNDVYLFFFVLAALFISFLNKSKFKTISINHFFNITSFILILITLVNIISYEIQIKIDLNSTNNETATEQDQDKPESTVKRDVYYIILDAYARQDILKDEYGYDNTEFIEHLKQKGFFVATNSTSNYAYSHLSIPSTFNFQYLDSLIEEHGTERRVIDPLLEKMFNENKVIDIFESKDYLTINFDSGWWFTQTLPSADINIHRGKYLYVFVEGDFTSVLLEASALSPFIKETLVEKKRDKILYNFAEIERLPYQKENTFALAHFVLPHPPWLFDNNGEVVTEDHPDGFSKELYVNQLQFTNKLVEEMVDKILSRSNPEPIIIIASDHGPLIPGLDGTKPPSVPNEKLVNTRMTNLNAYYFPDGGDHLLYNSITPVNSFRILFNYYFGTNYELLEDKNYFSWASDLYNFYDVTEWLGN